MIASIAVGIWAGAMMAGLTVLFIVIAVLSIVCLGEKRKRRK